MAKINQYPAKTVPSNNDEFVLHDPASGSTKKMTRGDLIGGAPLPPNSVTTEAIANGAVFPEKRSGGFKLGVIPASTFGTLGNKSITGVGFKPKLVKFTILPTPGIEDASLGFGAMSDDFQYYTYMSVNPPGRARNSGTTAAIVFHNSSAAGPLLVARYVSMDTDGFTFSVTTANSSFSVAYEAYA